MAIATAAVTCANAQLAAFAESGTMQWRPVGRVARRRPGRLSEFESRAEHARAHRLATERRRRDRRARAGRGSVSPTFKSGSAINWTMSVDLSGFNAAILGASRAIQRFGEAITVTAQTVLANDSLGMLLRLYGGEEAEQDETTGQDTIPCYSSNGARWSDLMSAIDELID